MRHPRLRAATVTAVVFAAIGATVAVAGAQSSPGRTMLHRHADWRVLPARPS